ncbi:acyltransferase domain-containing protein [Myxococcaceae bacterium JPH2]|nr:acyltransferase domain-containing protein [Myxococcaceae bacterium JPH2]
MSDAVDGVERIAIVGLSGRFPGARDLKGFWDNLRRGADARRVPTDAELDEAGVPRAMREQPQWVRASYVLEDASHFDAALFGYSPREAELMDPQQRLFLECSLEAMEHAGYDPERISGAVAVFGATSPSSYLLRALTRQPDLLDTAGTYALMLANDKDYLTTRVSHRLGLRGPSVAVQTACSSSLVAIHLACQSLLSGESDMALTGGTSVSFPQTAGYLYQEGMILSPDGYCRAFDADAKGTVRGAGAAVVVLKRLSDAVKDRDTIHAVILGTAINNDGSAKVGYTAPSVEGQAAVVAEALGIAGVEPGDIQYVEAHGTGTPLGDPIEVAALNQAFGGTELGAQRCVLGSLKASIGHLDAAAGVAGVMKTVLALQNRELPPTPHFQRPNPAIDFAGGPFFVTSEARPWESRGGPRRAGVSAFGIGGTNAHVVLEEAPPPSAATASRRPWHVLTLSARTPAALEAATTRLAEHLDANPSLPLADVAYTLQVGRRAYEHRRVLVCRDTADAREALRDARRALGGSGTNTRRPVVFVFSGQGTQHVGMARGLYESEPVFRKHLDACCDALTPRLGRDLRAVLFPAQGGEEAEALLRRTELAQPALFAVEYALAQLWRSLGVEPEAMVGHSLGEYVAACLAGVFSLEDALSLVATRGRLMQALPSGSMLSVHLPEAELSPLLPSGVSIAAANAPGLTVASGPEADIVALEAALTQRGVETRRLHTSHAFHSAMMDPVLEAFSREVARVRLSPPKIPYVSNLTGTWVTEAVATDPRAWTRHLREAVRFGDAATLLLQNSERVFLEIGPGNALATLLRRNAPAGTHPMVLTSLPGPRDAQQDALSHLTEATGRLWLAGGRVELSRGYKGEPRRRVGLPGYPFQRERFDLLRGPPPARAAVAASAVRASSDVRGLELSAPVWPRTPASVTVPSLQGQRWLVLESDTALAARVTERLRGAGADVVTLVAPERGDAPAQRRYAVSPETMGETLERLRDEGWTPERIAYLWPLTAMGTPASEATLDVTFHGLMALGRAVGPSAEAAPVSLYVVTRGARDVTGEEPLDPWQAAAVGACRVMAQEYPGLRSRAVDVTWPGEQAELTSPWVERLVAELAQDSSDGVALRGAHRHVEAFEPGAEPTASASLKQGGVYVIVGGLGRVGLALAEELTAAARPRLVLLSRKGLPAPEEWNAWLSGHDAKDVTSRAIERVRGLERAGAQVLALRADAGEPGELERAFQLAESRFGTVDGVFYAAGDGGMSARIPVAESTREASAPLLRARLGGLTQLVSVLASRKPDFVAVHSSLTTVLGGMACSAVAAAHAGMDALVARQARGVGTRWFAVDWDVWGVGEGFRPEAVIPPAEGFRLLRGLLTLPQGGRWVVTRGSLATRRQAATTGQAQATAGAATPANRHPRPPLANPFLAPRDETEERVAGIWRDLLGVEEVGVTDNFFELGGHSLLGVQVLSRIREAFHVELPMRALFDSPTVEVMSVAIVEASAKQVDPAELEALLAELEQG